MLKLVLGALTTAAFVCCLPEPASAQAALIPVTRLCPEATWAAGYYIWELIPLDSTRYKSAQVYNGSADARSGVGFEARVVSSLPIGTQVTIVGEAWDTGCNPWMHILYNDQKYWVHGYDLQLI